MRLKHPAERITRGGCYSLFSPCFSMIIPEPKKHKKAKTTADRKSRGDSELERWRGVSQSQNRWRLGGISILGMEMPPKKPHVGCWVRREGDLGGGNENIQIWMLLMNLLHSDIIRYYIHVGGLCNSCLNTVTFSSVFFYIQVWILLQSDTNVVTFMSESWYIHECCYNHECWYIHVWTLLHSDMNFVRFSYTRPS